MKYTPEPIFNTTVEHGEGPTWCHTTEQLYWVDLLKGILLVGNIATLTVRKYTIGAPLGVLALREKKGLVLATENDFIFLDTNNGDLKPITNNITNRKVKTRFNDGAVSPDGRFFAGTMSYDGKQEVGKLYRLDTDGSTSILEENMKIPNGMDWSLDGTIFYLTDTLNNCIHAYDYTTTSGSISNKRVHISFKSHEYPDGMTIDSEGNFWIAFWGGGKIGRYTSLGKHIQDILMPVTHPTSCCFGGSDMSTLLVTTSKLALNDKEKVNTPLAGSIFKLQTDTKGRHPFKYLG